MRWKEERGVTLIELLAVIVILGIIAAIGVPAILNSRENAQIVTYKSNAKILEEAAKRKLLAGEEYTSGTGDLADPDHQFNLTELLEEVGIDTTTGNLTNGTDKATFSLADGKGTYTLTPDGIVVFDSSDDSSSDDETDDTNNITDTDTNSITDTDDSSDPIDEDQDSN
ncbi:MAG: prepilin-type N-terminal cleavage/methylation domain-containing protein [Tumebacillaceae bacterium]